MCFSQYLVKFMSYIKDIKSQIPFSLGYGVKHIMIGEILLLNAYHIEWYFLMHSLEDAIMCINLINYI